MNRYTAALVAFLLHSPLAVAGAIQDSGSQHPAAAVSGVEMMRWSLGLFVVVAAIFACAWLVRKLGPFPAPGGGALRVVGGVSLGARERVVLLQAGKKQLVLGVSPGRIQTLHVLDAEDVAAMENKAPAATPSFSQRLQQAMRGVRHD